MRSIGLLASVPLVFILVGCATHRSLAPSISEAPREDLVLAEPLRIGILDARRYKEASEEVLDRLRSDLSSIYGDSLRWVPYFEETPPGKVTLRVRLMACGADFGSRVVPSAVVASISQRDSAMVSTPWGPVVAAGSSEQNLLASGLAAEGWWIGTAWVEVEIDDRRLEGAQRVAFPLVAEDRQSNTWGRASGDLAAERAWGRVAQALVAVLDRALVTLRDAEAR